MKYVDRTQNPRALAFLRELAEVCRRHGLTLSHEDTHGAFTVRPLYEKIDPEWEGGECVYDETESPQ